MLLRLACQLWRLRKLARQGPAEVHPGYRLIRTNGRLPTFSFGRWLFWNNQARLTAPEAQQLLQHELAHINGWHSADVLLVELVKVAFWFNPFLYLYGHALRAVHEYLADRQAVDGGNVSTYAQLMARQLLHPLPLPLTQPFSPFGIKSRITMLRRSQSTRPATWKMALGTMAVAALSLLYACRSLEVIEPEPGGLRGLAVIAKIPQQPPAPTDQFSKALARTLRYPAAARKAQTRGSVYASFLVHPDGHLSDIAIAKGVDEALDEEVLRALREVAAQSTWQPARLDGKPVERRASIPVTYSLHGLRPLPDAPNDGIVVIGYLGDAAKSDK
jgi:TonB family protein